MLHTKGLPTVAVVPKEKRFGENLLLIPNKKADVCAFAVHPWESRADTVHKYHACP